MIVAGELEIQEARTVTEHQENANWNVAEWHGKVLVDRDGEKIGKLQDVYVDVENDEPQFATVKEGFIGRHLTFVPLGGIKVGPDELQVTVTKRADYVCAEHRTTRRGAFPGRRVCPLPPLRTQLHAAGYRERSPPRPPLNCARTVVEEEIHDSEVTASPGRSEASSSSSRTRCSGLKPATRSPNVTGPSDRCSSSTASADQPNVRALTPSITRPLAS